MKSVIKALFFDKELVKAIRQGSIERAHLYNLLFSGKITMKEYLKAESK
jgi:hypothetical protein